MARTWLVRIVAVLFVTAVTGFGLVGGWALKQSSLPPSGDGWRYYLASIGHAWLVVVVIASPVLVPLVLCRVCRKITIR